VADGDLWSPGAHEVGVGMALHEAQDERGQAAYGQNCANCQGQRWARDRRGKAARRARSSCPRERPLPMPTYSTPTQDNAVDGRRRAPRRICDVLPSLLKFKGFPPEGGSEIARRL